MTRKKSLCYLEINDAASGTSLKFRGVTPKKAAEKLEEYMREFEDGKI